MNRVRILYVSTNLKSGCEENLLMILKQELLEIEVTLYLIFGVKKRGGVARNTSSLPTFKRSSIFNKPKITFSFYNHIYAVVPFPYIDSYIIFIGCIDTCSLHVKDIDEIVVIIANK